MRDNEYDQIIAEYFDIEDTNTRKILLALDEADRDNVVNSAVSKLYDSIIHKIDEIDCETITKSAGDITAVENYDKMVECLTIMGDIVKASNQPTTPLEVILEAINNIKDRKDIFERAFKLEIELHMVVYTMMTYACIASVSFMIASCIEFIKTPNDETFEISISNTGKFMTQGPLMFKNLEKFNKSCAKGDFDKAMEHIIRQKSKNFLGLTTGASVAVVVGAGIVFATLILNIVPIIRELIFTFYLARVKISDFFSIQADLLDMNAANVEMNSTIDKNKRKEISRKQYKIASRFRKISNTVEVKLKDANTKATSELKASDKKLKINDVITDKIPDSAGAASVASSGEDGMSTLF